MSVHLALGQRYEREFTGCGHGLVGEISPILDDISSGDEQRIKGGLHQVAGHVAGKLIVSNLEEHYRAVTEVAGGISRGEFAEGGVGLLTAGAQYKVAELARSEGHMVSPDQILGVFDAAVKCPRGEDFEYWMRVTTLAGLRVSSDPKEATLFLGRLLAEPTVQRDIGLQAPSRMREGLMLAAPSALNPQLLGCYELSLRYGSRIERGLALLSVEQVPAKLSSTTHAGIISTLKTWARRYGEALATLLDDSNFTGVSKPPPQQSLWNREDVEAIRRALIESAR